MYSVHFQNSSIQYHTSILGSECDRYGEERCQVYFTIALHEMLKMNKTLSYLNLSDNGISDLGICFIFQALQHNTALVHLDLHDFGMCMSDEVAVCIAKTLESNCFLQVLDIRYSNPIGNIGFDHITKLLESNTTLRELHLVYYIHIIMVTQQWMIQ